MRKWLEKSRPVGLTVCIVALLLVYPYFHNGGLARTILNILFSLTVLSAFLSRKGHWLSRLLILGLGIVWLSGRWGQEWTGRGSRLDIVSLGALVAFCLVLLVVQLTLIVRSKEVDADTLFRAVNGYLLIGLAWSGLYQMLTLLDGGAILAGGVAIAETPRDLWSSLMYFSFVTLTTLGYGDIVPHSAHAQSLATIEAIIGQLYIAMLVARLIAAFSMRQIVEREEQLD
jgi:hypothetical protein